MIARIDVILIAPKGSGTSLRRMFLEGRGLNSSFAVFQDATGRAFERVVALAKQYDVLVVHDLAYAGPFLIEMWTEKAKEPVLEIIQARRWIEARMQEGGMTC